MTLPYRFVLQVATIQGKRVRTGDDEFALELRLPGGALLRMASRLDESGWQATASLIQGLEILGSAEARARTAALDGESAALEHLSAKLPQSYALASMVREALATEHRIVRPARR